MTDARQRPCGRLDVVEREHGVAGKRSLEQLADQRLLCAERDVIAAAIGALDQRIVRGETDVVCVAGLHVRRERTEIALGGEVRRRLRLHRRDARIAPAFGRLHGEPDEGDDGRAQRDEGNAFQWLAVFRQSIQHDTILVALNKKTAVEFGGAANPGREGALYGDRR